MECRRCDAKSVSVHAVLSGVMASGPMKLIPKSRSTSVKVSDRIAWTFVVNASRLSVWQGVVPNKRPSNVDELDDAR